MAVDTAMREIRGLMLQKKHHDHKGSRRVSPLFKSGSLTDCVNVLIKHGMELESKANLLKLNGGYRSNSFFKSSRNKL
jgi:hypothetical protein